LKPRNIAALHDKASIHLYLEEYQQADICFDKILVLDPLNVEAMINKGLLALSVENYHIATELFNRAIKIEKDSPKVVACKELLSKIGFLFEK
jgi:tetratricopeptide (TPR) repeat protein